MYIPSKAARWTNIWLLFLMLLLPACEQAPKKTAASYLYLAHSRLPHTMANRVLPQVAEIAFDSFDLLVLGGDLTFRSAIDQDQVDYLDSIFALSDPSTLLCMGNHEYDSLPELLTQKTGRPSYFAHHQDGVSWLILDTNLDSCRITGKQWALVEQTLDELEEHQSHHLIVALHHLIWLVDGGPLQANHKKISNVPISRCPFCIQPTTNFYTELYPRLVEVQQQGIQVICVSGDLGNMRTHYEHQTKEGIVFLAEGLKHDADNHVLVFHHQIDSQQLHWTFESLDQLPQQANPQNIKE